MKRPIVVALIIGLIVAALIIGLDIAGLLARADGVARFFPETATRLIAAVGYGIVVIAAIGVAFLALSGMRRARMLLIVAILLVELLVLAWVCA
ncbi:MAG TPA: hypothetical protein VE086_06375, partial [Chthoniobacterales bacterium]|nr:hypothetical protein [Chthoniobacterales bacterium]